MNNNLCYLSRHHLTRTYIERYTLPTPVIHKKLHRKECLSATIWIYLILLTVTNMMLTLPFALSILTTDYIILNICIRHRAERLIHLDNLITEVVSIELYRRFHSHKSEKLREVVLHHITHSSCLVVKSATALYSHILNRRNFYTVNIIAVPQRLKDTISKT